MQYKKKKIIDGIVRRETFIEISSPVQLPKKNQLKYSGLKMVGVSLFAVILLTGLSSVGSTISYFNDTEISTNNRLQAGIVGFNISFGNSTFSRLSANSLASTLDEVEEPKQEEGIKRFNVTVGIDEGSLPLVYTASGELDSSNPPGCEVMILSSGFGSNHSYGFVKDFISPKLKEVGEWTFTASLPSSTDIPSGAICRGEIVFKVELSGVESDLSKTFTDEKRYSFEVQNWTAKVEETTKEEIISVPEEDSVTVETSTETVSEEPKEIEETKESEVVVEEEVTPEDTAPEVTETVPEEVVEETVVEETIPEPALSSETPEATPADPVL